MVVSGRVLAAAIGVNLLIFLGAPYLILRIDKPPKPEPKRRAYTVRAVSLPSVRRTAASRELQPAEQPTTAPPGPPRPADVRKPTPLLRAPEVPPVSGASLISLRQALKPDLSPGRILAGLSSAFAPSTLTVPGSPDGSAADQVDRMPEVVSRAPLMYPEKARQQGIEGSVTVRFLVDAQGKVGPVEILRSVPPGVFDGTVRRTIGSYRFKPGLKDGTPVPTWMETTVSFRLDENA